MSGFEARPRSGVRVERFPNRQRSRTEVLAECRTLHEFGCPAADAIGLLQSVDRGDVGMVQWPTRAPRARSAPAGRALTEAIRHDLDGDVAARVVSRAR
jgi:hypothetical protein